jgi:hypothetical protein
LRWPRDTLYPQNLALTSPISGRRLVGIVRLRIKSHGVFFIHCIGMEGMSQRTPRGTKEQQRKTVVRITNRSLGTWTMAVYFARFVSVLMKDVTHFTNSLSEVRTCKPGLPWCQRRHAQPTSATAVCVCGMLLPDCLGSTVLSNCRSSRQHNCKHWQYYHYCHNSWYS